MIFTKKFFIILAPTLFFIGLEFLNLKESWLYELIAAIIIVSFFSVWLVTTKKFNVTFLKFLISPFLFTISTILFFIFLTPQSLIFKHFFIVLVSALFYLILEKVHSFFHQTDEYLTDSLKGISSYLNLVSIFFFSASFYIITTFFTSLFWLIEIFLIFITAALIYQTLWMNKLLDKKSILFIFIISLIIAEIFLSLCFLPTSFYVNAFITTIIYYLLTEITYFYLLKKLETKIIKRYFIIIFIILVIIFLTTKWS